MAGSWGPSKAYLRRRKKKTSNRRWILFSKKARAIPEPIPARQHVHCEMVDKTSSDQMEDNHVRTTQKRVPLLDVWSLLLAVRTACQVSKNRFCQVYIRFVNAICFWRGYTNQIKTLEHQMAELQKEMVALHALLQDKGVVQTMCQCHGTLVGGPLHLKIPIHPPLAVGGCGSRVNGLPTLTPPAPPPPPPPPPPLPSITVLQPLVKKTVSSNSLQNAKEKQDRLVAVTLRDLQAVKLKKVIPGNRRKVKSPEKMRTPLVTLADLQKVRLRRPHFDLPPKIHFSLTRTPKKSPSNVPPQLKRVQINRSPGGTPLLDKENMETGSGLTPMMTQALRRKFLSVLPRGPSPTFMNSNGCSDDDFVEI